MIRVVVVDDEALVRSGFELILGASEDIEVVATASLEARPPSAHPAPVGSTPAEWLDNTAVRSRRTGSGRDSAGRQGGTRRPAGPVPKTAGWSAPPAGHARFSA